MADETNNKNAVFKFYLNRQGVKGNKGEKGEQGFSPIIEVSENTAASYKLQITTETDQFESPNLRGNAVEDLGGTYMRYDPETQTMYADVADVATKTNQGEVTLASDEDVANLSENKVITPAGIVDNATSLFQSSDGSIVITQDENNGKINLKANTSSIEGDITALEARVGTCEGDILSNAGRIQTLEHNLALDEQAIQNNTLAIANKVDKVAGKGLSTNDFTDADNDKLMHAVVDTDLADVAFSGDYGDLLNKPTIPVIPADNLTGSSVDGTTIVYDNVTGKISATPDLSNYVTKNTAQEINNTKTFLGNSLQVGNGTDSDIVASYDSTIYQTTETGFSRVAGAVIGSLLQGSNSTLATQSMFEYDDDIQDFRIATIFNDFNLTGGTNVGIIKNAQTGRYEIVAHDTTYSQGNGIDINNANQISVKVDGTTVQFNASGELEASGGSITVDQTFNGTSANAQSGIAIAGKLNDYVTTNTVQTVTGTKTFQNAELILGSGTYSKFSLTNASGNSLRPESQTSTGLMHLTYNDAFNVATISSNRTLINGHTRGLLRILPTTNYSDSSIEGYIMTHNLVDMSYKPYLTVNKITSTGGTVTITDNGINGINIEAAGGSTPANMVTTDTSQIITGEKTLNNILNFTANNSNSTFSIDRNAENITITASPENALYTQPFKIGREGSGMYSGIEGYFFDVEDGQNGLWIGKLNTRSCITTNTAGKVLIFPNPLVNNANERFTIGLNDELTYRKADGTVIDIIAFETRIAALESKVAALETLINGGNA